ncbi:uncharacterized protein LOC123306745 isoform X2 [Coccinella septempunctata]|uniref:uncharacterized protein LOC123306745 isoform X2 n=2 Tax=Coccinella septempunctata TaxID=41139 RepID=UPI001D06E39D|nr:uncharacterized protein LOC123306745 isoform X2 [Coccinella septempunctata]
MLSLGPKFSIPYSKSDFPWLDLMSDIEGFILGQDHLDVDMKNGLRASLCGLAYGFYKRLTNGASLDPFHKYLLFLFRKTKAFLEANPDIYVVNSDKGNKTVVINKSDYDRKLLDLLSDSETYKQLKADPTIGVQVKSNKLIRQLEDFSLVSEIEGKRLRKYNSVPPKIYGLVKIHKTGNPLRPVVSCCNSPTYNISKFLCTVLSRIKHLFPFSIRNSYDLINKINGITNIPDDYVLISVDVKSLFTNIPQDLVERLIKDNWAVYESCVNVPLDVLLNIIKFIFDNSFFQYNKRFYAQVRGTAMGNPASPILAELVMNHLIAFVLSVLNFHIPVVFVYVDDIIMSVPMSRLEEVLRIFNSFHENLQFTHEMEIDGKIPFLDLLLIRDSGGIKTDLYSKPMASHRTLHFNSLHSTSQKIAVVRGIKQKILSLSDTSFHPKNFKQQATILCQNGYPKTLVNKIFYGSKYSTSIPSTDNGSDKEIFRYYKLVYIPKLSQMLIRLMKGTSTIVVSYYNKTVKSLFSRLKDIDPPMRQSGLVYGVGCSNCDAIYVGQTCQYFGSRLRQHQLDCKRQSEATALSQHAKNEGHLFDFENAKILTKETNWFKRSFKEMLLIRKHPNSVNSRSDIGSLSIAYSNLIKEINK